MKSILICLSLLPILSMANIIPHNNLNIPALEKGEMLKKQYDSIVNKFDVLYRPVIEDLGIKFSINSFWEDGTVNASAGKRGKEFRLQVYGGLARYEAMTNDAFILVLCHEMGHLIGGAPTWKPLSISSSEGQADYYSTLKCFRKYMQDENNKAFLKTKRIHPLALENCKRSFKKKADYNICLRSSLATQDLAGVIAKLRELDFIPDLDTPDPQVRRLILFNGYPSPQCRIDTLHAGSICANQDGIDVLSNDLYNANVCSEVEGHNIGIRPKCWYASREDKPTN